MSKSLSENTSVTQAIAFHTSQWKPSVLRQRWNGLWLGWFALLVAVVSPNLAKTSWAHNPPVRSIEVQAQAQLEVNPDVVDLTIRLQSMAPMPKQAVRSLMQKRDNLLKIMKKAGLKATDLSMSHISIYPRYKRGELKGYQASMSVVACIKSIPKLAHYIDAAARAGISSLGTSFRSLKVPTHKAKLQEMALKAAKAKVKRMAKVMGVKVGRLYYVKNVQLQYAGSWSNSFAYRRRSGSSGPIQPGAIKMSLQIRVGYFIAD